MRRLFIPGRLADTVTLSGSDAHHLGYTLRARVGERVVAVDAERQVASMEITGFTADTVTLRLVERLAADTESPVRLAIAVCLLKSDKMDFVVQKAVELGAAKVQPVESENCVARYDGKKAEARRERWQRVADEAAKQCGRTALLTVAPMLSFDEWIKKRPPEDGAAFFCYEAEEKKTLGAWLAETEGGAFTAVIGPEGGFTPAEAGRAKAAGIAAVTLGPRILRAETAAIVTLAIVQHSKGDLGRE
ncbi:MAG: 16S rRNA (uracil(1498)-N(3))-methyltransferase [Schwartzia sp.]|nr:16S rRNA (uracil(1498)-N(3))-methyltransferase [Schwartzia sp. (in: firmicutes)]MBR1760125.1 16S rRNA (uracil(1498)-N(3))-methyltransferase [Schwartzia sp. (in: firmicutes)]